MSAPPELVTPPTSIYTLLGVRISNPTNGQVLAYNAALGVFTNQSGGGGGAVSSVSNVDGTLTVTPTTGSVVASLALGHANTWTAVQTFGTNISILGAAFSGSAPTTNQVIQYNGSHWVAATLASGAVSSVSNSDGSLTISPTTGAVVASLNVANSNTWTALQIYTVSGALGAILINDSNTTLGVNAFDVEFAAIISTTTYTSYPMYLDVTPELNDGTNTLTGVTGLFVNVDGGLAGNAGNPWDLSGITILLNPVIGDGATTGLYINNQSSSGTGIYVNNPNSAYGIYVTSAGGAAGVYVANTGTTGSGLQVFNLLSAVGGYFENSANGVALGVVTDVGIGIAIDVATMGGGTCIAITNGSSSGSKTQPALTMGYGAQFALPTTTFFTLTFGGLVTVYNGVATVQGGLPAEYASTGTTAVSLGTGSTTILTLGSTLASGLYLVVINVVSNSALISGTLTVTYTDFTLSATTTQSITVAALGSGAGSSYFVLCNAKTGTAITVAGTASTATDLKATCAIFGA